MINKKDINELFSYLKDIFLHIKILFNPNKYLDVINSITLKKNLIDSIFFILILTSILYIPFLFFDFQTENIKYYNIVLTRFIYPIQYLLVFIVITYDLNKRFLRNLNNAIFFSLNYTQLIFFVPILNMFLYLVTEKYFFYYFGFITALSSTFFICILLNIILHAKRLQKIFKIFISLILFFLINFTVGRIIKISDVDNVAELADPIFFEFNHNDIIELSSIQYIDNSFKIIRDCHEEYKKNQDPIYLEVRIKTLEALEQKKESINKTLEKIIFRRNRKWLINSIEMINKIIDLDTEYSRIYPLKEDSSLLIAEQKDHIDNMSKLIDENDIILYDINNILLNDFIEIENINLLINDLENKIFIDDSELKKDSNIVKSKIDNLSQTNFSIDENFIEIEHRKNKISQEERIINSINSEIEMNIFLMKNNIHATDAMNEIYSDIIELNNNIIENFEESIRILKLKNIIWVLP